MLPKVLESLQQYLSWQHGSSGCTGIPSTVKVTSAKSVAVLRVWQYYRNDSDRRRPLMSFCNKKHESHSEISREVSCCRKKMVETGVRVGERRLVGVQKSWLNIELIFDNHLTRFLSVTSPWTRLCSWLTKRTFVRRPVRRLANWLASCPRRHIVKLLIL